MNFDACLHPVSNRGPDGPVSLARLKNFLTALVTWAKAEDDSVFAPNSVPVDIFTIIKAKLASPAGADAAGTPIFHWDSILHRKTAMMEAMRGHAGFESAWTWGEGVDITNKTSMRQIEGQETGIFQVSFDSTYLGNRAMKSFAAENGIATPETFIPKMKEDHELALRYYARLVRVSIAWAGPLVRHEIVPFLRRDAMLELEALIA